MQISQMTAEPTTALARPATITRVEQGGEAWTAPVRGKVLAEVRGSFRSAVRDAAELVRENSRWTDRFFNDQRTIAIRQSADGVFELAAAGASIHLFNPIDSPKYVAARAERGDDAALLALVSRDNWVDLRQRDAADAERLVRIPGVGPIVR